MKIHVEYFCEDNMQYNTCTRGTRGHMVHSVMHISKGGLEFFGQIIDEISGSIYVDKNP